MNLPVNSSTYLPTVPALGVHRDSTIHPLQYGEIIHSPGCHFTYRVIGPCCRLFDRETLPWPSCRIEWHSKEPSWRRIGKRYVADMATRNSPSYSVEIVGQEGKRDPIEITVYAIKLTPAQREWWHSRKPATLGQAYPPES
ncbi:hypothetical protein [Romeriopsis navalis]|uniref:hypothetical protein n=1 Tax=Romeriopsis navalis TaxID=2992132 RepID=UPI0021F86999|nr:hypothetical protein [Romeriopsis navalis]